MTQDEVIGLRDIIRHDEKMDAQALEKIEALKVDVNSVDGIPEIEIFDRLDDIAACIRSTLADTKKSPGTATDVGIVQSNA